MKRLLSFALCYLSTCAGCARTREATSAPSAAPSRTPSTTGSRGGVPSSAQGLVVLVVDEANAPISGAEVSATYSKNPGPLPSTCCMSQSLGKATTGADGLARLASPPFTLRPVEVTASRSGWPPRTVSAGLGASARHDAHGRLLIVLGPARDVAGRIQTTADCPADFIEVVGASPMTRSLVDASGHFVLRGLAPGTIHAGFTACGRSAKASIETSRPESLVIQLPPRAPPREPYALAAAASAPLSEAAAPAAAPWPSPSAANCVPPSGELVIAGDFHAAAIDPRCRFFLAGRADPALGFRVHRWTLVRPDGSTLELGPSWPASPVLGDKVALLSSTTSHLSLDVVELATGRRLGTYGPLARFELGARDAVVLAKRNPGGGYQTVALEIRWPDGSVQELAKRASPSWSVFGNARFLTYGVMSESSTALEVHLVDLTTRRNKRIASNAHGAWPTADGSVLAVTSEQHLTLHHLSPERSETLDGPGSSWRLYGDVQLKVERDGTAILRRGGATLPLSFKWPYAARERRVSERHLLFGANGNAVSVDTISGIPRLLGEGVRVPDHEAPPLSGDWIAVAEDGGRAMLLSLSGKPPRAVGRGRPRAFSPDGRWLFIERDLAREIILTPMDASKTAVTLRGWGGLFAPDEPATFFHTGDAAYDVPRPLYVTRLDRGASSVLEPRVISYEPLGNQQVLVIVPPGGARRAGIWRLALR